LPLTTGYRGCCCCAFASGCGMSPSPPRAGRRCRRAN